MQLPAAQFFNTVPFVIGQDLQAKKKQQNSRKFQCASLQSLKAKAPRLKINITPEVIT